MMPNLSIEVDNIGKRYRLGEYAGSGMYRYGALREKFASALKAPVRLCARPGKPQVTACDGEIWALRGVSFGVKEGETLGLIGSNGAGKSTLLKVLSRITEPTEGSARIRGRVGSLLEVGTGFHPELTGRENIYLSGAILGMNRDYIRRKFDGIVGFAGIERFVDTPVKRYSSGMWVRLGFAVAAHLEPEILLVDEVLAVGDAVFQRRCVGKIGDVAKEGRTVIFVSHNMGAVARLCGRCLWLDNGRLEMSGEPGMVISRYLSSKGGMSAEYSMAQSSKAPRNGRFALRAVRVKDRDGNAQASIDARHDCFIEIEYQLVGPIPGLRVGYRLLASDGSVLLSSTDRDGGRRTEADCLPGVYVSRCTIPGGLLNRGRYSISLGIDIPKVESILFIDNIVSFDIEIAGDLGGTRSDNRLGFICPHLPWDVEQLDIRPHRRPAGNRRPQGRRLPQVGARPC
jgi:lipopolysaccharide transport system ATP-binding protein